MSDELQNSKPARGCHKIFLGYAAGVGKTYTMLAEAHRRASRGEDIVIGYVEPHLRPDTDGARRGARAGPAEGHRVPRHARSPSSTPTRSSLATPATVLVDELAHTNVPGTRHEKRWQSVEELLDAGINVLSTVNVQHFESLNDTVCQITGVCVRETLPDRVLDEADEVELVDVPPDALLNRLKRGAIYAPEKVDQALSNFFRRGNLVALRELALRKTAEEVDDDLEEFIATHDVDKTWGAVDRVLVAVTPRHAEREADPTRLPAGASTRRRPVGRPRQAVRGAARRVRAERGRRAARADRGARRRLHRRGRRRRRVGHHRVRPLPPDHVHRAWASRCEAGSTRSCTARSSSRIMRETRNIDVVIVAEDRMTSAERV